MSPQNVPAPRASRTRDPFDQDAERQAAALTRAIGLHDAEQQLRRRLKHELLEELRRPLIEKHGPSGLDAIAALAPRSRPAR